MKFKLIIPFILAICYASLSQAQRGPYYGDRYNSSYDYGDRYDRSDRNYRYYDRLSRNDRKRLRRLTRKLEERERCAWDDGYVSRRERRRINEVRNDIDNLLYGYRNRNQNRRRRSLVNIVTPFCR